MEKLKSQHGKHVCREVTSVFKKFSDCPQEVDANDLKVLERYVVVMYDRSSSCASVTDARLDFFARKLRAYDSIPPSQSALLEHAKRAAFQAGYIMESGISSSD